MLRQAGLEGLVPTPLDAVAAAVGIGEVLDISDFNALHLEVHRRRRAPGVVLKRFVGAVFFQPKVVLIDTSKPEPMQRWTEAHELSHKLLPGHEESTYLDNDETLSPHAREVKEKEANVAAAQMLFQGAPFWERGLALQQGLAVPIALAEQFETSITAAIRYYVETHPDRVGLVCASRYVQSGSRRIIYGHQSPAFVDQFGPAVTQFPTRQLPANTTDGGLGEAIGAACRERTVHACELVGYDLNGETTEFSAEVFFNGYSVFVLLRPRRRLTLGRRLRIQDAQSD